MRNVGNKVVAKEPRKNEEDTTYNRVIFKNWIRTLLSVIFDLPNVYSEYCTTRCMATDHGISFALVTPNTVKGGMRLDTVRLNPKKSRRISLISSQEPTFVLDIVFKSPLDISSTVAGNSGSSFQTSNL
jgi:hypothetical protein